MLERFECFPGETVAGTDGRGRKETLDEQSQLMVPDLRNLLRHGLLLETVGIYTIRYVNTVCIFTLLGWMDMG